MERRNARRQNSPVFSFGFAPRESTSPKTPEKPADSGKSKNPSEFREGSETPSKPRGSDPRGSRSPFSIPRPRSFKRSDMQSDAHPAAAQSDAHPDIHADLHHSPRSDTRSDIHPNQNQSQSQNEPPNAHPDTHPDAHSAYWLPRSRLGQSEPPSGPPSGTATASEAPSGNSSGYSSGYSSGTASGYSSGTSAGYSSGGPSFGPSVHAGSSGPSGYRNPFYCYFERQRSFRPRRPALGRRGGER